jgi:hypothetical protein
MSRYQVPLQIAFILVAPVAAVVVFDINLINQDAMLDPWYYTGLGQNFRLLQGIFGWNYYAVRFPVIFLNTVFPGSMDPVAGYILLRYLILLACGVPLFLLSRQRFGTWIAVAAYLFLFCNPLLPRVILWDLTPFVSVPMALAGICVWHLEVRGRGLNRVLAGFLFCASIGSQAFTGTAILAFFLVELCHRLAKRQIRALILLDILAPSVGGAICFALGMLFYYIETGLLDPSIVFTATAAAAEAAASLHGTTSFAWLTSEYEIYIPYLLVLIAVVGLGPAMLSGSVESRLAWFGLLYASAYAVYQFAFHAFVLEIFYYFGHLTIVAYLLFPLCLAVIVKRLAISSAAFVLAPAIGMLLLFPMFNRFAPALIDTIQAWTIGSISAAIAISLAGVMCAALVRLRSQIASALAIAVMLVGLAQLLSFASPSHRPIFLDQRDSSTRGHREFGVYRAAIDMLQSFSAFAKPDAKVVLWFSNDDYSLASIAAAVLEYTLQPPYQPHAGPPTIGTYELTQLQIPDIRYVMILSMSEVGLESGVHALQRAGIAVRDVLHRQIGDDAFRAYLEIVEIGNVPSVATEK